MSQNTATSQVLAELRRLRNGLSDSDPFTQRRRVRTCQKTLLQMRKARVRQRPAQTIRTPAIAAILMACLGLCSSANSVAGTVTAEPASPKSVIAAFDGDLLHSLHQPPTQPWSKRLTYWSPIVRTDFDVSEIAKLTLGPDYAKLNPAQKQAFQDLLVEYTAASYAHHFHHGNATIRITGTESLSPTTAAVLTQLRTRTGKRHTLDYVLMPNSDHHWQIVNVVADGVSDLSLKRAEYTAEFAKGGFPRLAAKIRAEIARLAG